MVALAQMAPRLGHPRINLDSHRQSAETARARGAGVVVFPELSLTGYVLRDQVPEVALTADSPEIVSLAESSREIDVLAGFVEEAAGHRFYNSCGYFSKGRLVHVHRKVYLATYGMFDEGRDFAAGDRVRAFESAFGPAGIMICEDSWHPTTAWVLAQDGAEVMFVVSSGPTRGAREGQGITSLSVWESLLTVTARFQTAWVVYVNRVGFEDGLNFGGGSMVVDPFGRVTASLPALDPDLRIATLQGEVLRRARAAYPLLRDDDIELVHREIARLRTVRFDLPEEGREIVGERPSRPARRRS